ncbi:MAG TPA: hypothetical protein PKH72_15380 [Rhodoferax sp.]|jgi:hypothetical protein|nr:hypothetical protein [Rhodoferax sp.]
MPLATIEKIVALHCGLDPDRVSSVDLIFGARPGMSSAELVFNQYVNLACAHIANGTLECLERNNDKIQKSIVSLPVYAAWVDAIGDEVPKQFPRVNVLSVALPEASSGGTRYKWPWGSHETKLLRLLEQAATFWKPVSEGGNYDPTDPDTAPTNEFMHEWLQRHGASIKGSHVMATMLRADTMPSGRRPVKKKG